MVIKLILRGWLLTPKMGTPNTVILILSILSTLHLSLLKFQIRMRFLII